MKIILHHQLMLEFFADTCLSKRWSLNYEVLFSGINTLAFIEIPLHIKYDITKKWSVFAGPKLDISAESTGTLNAIRTQPTGLSIDVGTQYNFTKRLFIEARYGQGLTRQFRGFQDIIPSGSGPRSVNVFRFGVGFRF